jgi:hypothetical protein
MPTIVLADVLTAAGSIVTVVGPYLVFGVGFLAAGWLLRKGFGMLARGTRR